MKLKDKVLVITGATGGVGLATARVAAREGARVVICGRNGTAVSETVACIKQAGGNISGIPADVARPDDLAELLSYTDKLWGRVDIWINNAGVGTGTRPMTECSAKEIADTVAINLTGTAEACRIVIPYMLRNNGGVLCNTVGRGADFKPQGSAAIYSATKAAVMSLTMSLAQENLGKNISIHAISPGLVNTGLHRTRLDESRDPVIAAQWRKALSARGTSPEIVGAYFVDVISQVPGKLTGRFYHIVAGVTSETDLLDGFR